MKRLPLYLVLTAALILGLQSCEPETLPGSINTEKPGKDDGDGDKPTPPDPDPDPDPEPEPEPEPDPDGTVIYYDNLDKEKSTSNSNYFNTWTDCRNMEGTGVSSVTYDGFYSSVRSTYESSDYPGASGVNGVYYSQDGGRSYIQVKNVALPSDARTYKLSVGLYNPNGAVVPGQTFSIGIADEESLSKDYRELDFSVAQHGKWYYATAVFEITSPETEHISIQLRSLVAKTRSDDLKLVTTEDTPGQGFGFIHKEPAPETRDYIERPKALVECSTYKYVDHRGEAYRTKTDARNYEACYDVKRHNPVWVAFPCHRMYWGGGSRPCNDPWRPDPLFDESEQSVIYGADWENWSVETYKGAYWTHAKTSSLGLTRGHLLPSYDRGMTAKDKENKMLYELNTQTFYPTNIAPERYLNYDGKTSHWSMVENLRHDSKWECSDTLYIVIGCVYNDKEDWIVYDNSLNYSVSATSKACVMPYARYLVALRTKTGTTGKPIYDCSASEVMAIGFWFPQSNTNATLSTLPPLADYIYSVSEIEKKIDNEFSFFPLAPEGVKDSYRISDWPGLAAIAGTKTSQSGMTTDDMMPVSGQTEW